MLDVIQIYTHVYTSEGTYNVIANISNPYTSGVVSVTVFVAIPILNMMLVYPVAQASVNVPFIMGVSMDSGSGVILTFDFGYPAAGATQVFPRVGRSVLYI